MPVLFFKQGVTISTPQKQKLFSRINLLSHIEEKQIGDINIIYTTDEGLLKINNKYLHHNFYTDIITFDYSKGSTISGDLFISVERVKENAKTYKVPYPEEIHRVIIHGILHLAGYKDKKKKDVAAIRKKENFYLGAAL